MTTEPTPRPEPPHHARPASVLECAAALIEVVLGFSFVVTFILALLLKYTIGLRLDPEAEAAGIDEAEHAESAYDFAVSTSSVLPRASLPDSSNGLDGAVAEKVEAEQS